MSYIFVDLQRRRGYDQPVDLDLERKWLDWANRGGQPPHPIVSSDKDQYSNAIVLTIYTRDYGLVLLKECYPLIRV